MWLATIRDDLKLHQLGAPAYALHTSRQKPTPTGALRVHYLDAKDQLVSPLVSHTFATVAYESGPLIVVSSATATAVGTEGDATADPDVRMPWHELNASFAALAAPDRGLLGPSERLIIGDFMDVFGAPASLKGRQSPVSLQARTQSLGAEPHAAPAPRSAYGENARACTLVLSLLAIILFAIQGIGSVAVWAVGATALAAAVWLAVALWHERRVLRRGSTADSDRMTATDICRRCLLLAIPALAAAILARAIAEDSANGHLIYTAIIVGVTVITGLIVYFAERRKWRIGSLSTVFVGLVTLHWKWPFGQWQMGTPRSGGFALGALVPTGVAITAAIMTLQAITLAGGDPVSLAGRWQLASLSIANESGFVSHKVPFIALEQLTIRRVSGCAGRRCPYEVIPSRVRRNVGCTSASCAYTVGPDQAAPFTLSPRRGGVWIGTRTSVGGCSFKGASATIADAGFHNVETLTLKPHFSTWSPPQFAEIRIHVVGAPIKVSDAQRNCVSKADETVTGSVVRASKST